MSSSKRAFQITCARKVWCLAQSRCLDKSAQKKHPKIILQHHQERNHPSNHNQMTHPPTTQESSSQSRSMHGRLAVGSAFLPDPEGSPFPTTTGFSSSFTFKSFLHLQIPELRKPKQTHKNRARKSSHGRNWGSESLTCSVVRFVVVVKRGPPAASRPKSASETCKNAASGRGSRNRPRKLERRRLGRPNRRGQNTWCWIRCFHRRRPRWRTASCDGTRGRGCPRQQAPRGGWTPRPIRRAQRQSGTAG
jgi:hypothetical protein